MLSYRIGTIIKGHIGDKFLYTENYINLQKAKLAGALEASIKPVRISQLTKDYSLDLNMIFGKFNLISIILKRTKTYFALSDIFDGLLSSKQIDGVIFGGRQEMSVYVPTIYTQAQKIYVESFFRQNGSIGKKCLKKLIFDN
jgi:hypothetical protein